MKTKLSIFAVVISCLLLTLTISCKKEAPKVIPTLTTTVATNITSTSATCGGAITNDGNSPVTSRGVCWGANQSPTISDSKTNDGIGIGSFTSSIANLSPGGIYYARAYATNAVGTAYGNQLSLTTSAIIPTLTTTAITDIGATSATSGGNITSDGGAAVTARGICWSTNQTPTIANSKTVETSGLSIFTSLIIGLSPSTTYYVRAYATNSVGTGYGTAISLTSLNVETLRYCLEAFPGVKGEIVTTTLNGTTVTCERINGLDIFQGDIILAPSTKGTGMTQQDHMWPDGIVYYTINADFPEKDRITNGFKRFEDKSNITFKQRNNETNYVEFTYIKDAGCYSYLGKIGGKQLIVIDTWGEPGDVAHEIGHAIGLYHEQSKTGRDAYVTINFDNIEKGQEHNFIVYPNSVSTSGFDFNSLMLYHSYSFSIQSGVLPTIVKKDGSLLFPQREQFTETDISMINLMYPTTPKLTTTAVSTISSTTAFSGGTILFDGGWHVNARGVCWSTSQNPTILDKKTSDGTGSGNFTSSITGLTPNTKYYIRAYATNSSGIGPGYGEQLSFTTLQNIITPTVTTSDATNITNTSVTSGGNITNDGGATVTTRGVCWSTSQNPTTTNSKITNGVGTGSFPCTITGLTSGTTYYIRAFATNSQGTGYGNQVSATTEALAPNSIEINSTPTGASVYLDGTNMNTITPATLTNVNAGYHNVRLFKFGYNEYLRDIYLASGESFSINANLGSPVPPLPVFSITQPLTNAHLSSNVLIVSGSILLRSSTGTNSSFTGDHAILTLNGVDQEIPVSNGNFSQKVLISAGENRIRLRANSNNGDTGISNEIIFYGDFTVSDIQIILRWNNGTDQYGTNRKDVDLHVYDSYNHHTYWQCTSAYSGSTHDAAVANMIPGSILDIDNTWGFGPETFTLKNSTSTTYTVKAHFYSGYESSYPTYANIEITLKGNETKTYGPYRFKNSYDKSPYTMYEDPDCWWNVVSFTVSGGLVNVANSSPSINNAPKTNNVREESNQYKPKSYYLKPTK